MTMRVGPDYRIGEIVGRVEPRAEPVLSSPAIPEWRLAEVATGIAGAETPGLALARAGLCSWRPVMRVRRRIGRSARRSTVVVPAFGAYLFVDVALADFGAALAVMHQGRTVLRRVQDGRVPSGVIALLRARWDAPLPDAPLPPLARGDRVELRCGTSMPGKPGVVVAVEGDAVRIEVDFFGARIPATVPRGLLDRMEDGRCRR